MCIKVLLQTVETSEVSIKSFNRLVKLVILKKVVGLVIRLLQSTHCSDIKTRRPPRELGICQSTVVKVSNKRIHLSMTKFKLFNPYIMMIVPDMLYLLQRS